MILLNLKTRIHNLFSNNFFLKIISNIRFILPSNILCFAFKHSLKVNNFKIAKKLHSILINRNNNQSLCLKIIVLELVATDFQKLLKINILNKNSLIKKIKFKKKLLLTKNQNKKFLGMEIIYILNYIIDTFHFCDCRSNGFYEFLKFKYKILNQKNIKKNYFLDGSFIKAIGHYYLLDTFIKGIILKILPIRKFNFLPNSKVANFFLFKKYLSFAKKKNLLLNYRNIDKNHLIDFRLWPLKKGFADAFQLGEKIQDLWIKKYGTNSYLLSKKDKLNFENLKKKLKFKNKTIVTVHIRESGFNPDDNINKFRDSNAKLIYEVLSKQSKNFQFIIFGDKHSSKVDQKYYNIFDYANSEIKNAKNDILFTNYSDAHIGTTSGITHQYLCTNKPTLLVNWHPLTYKLKNKYSILVPKILKKNNGKIFSFNDLHKIKPSFDYSGTSRLENLNLKCEDLSYEDLFNSISLFLKKFKSKRWVNYGYKYKIRSDNLEYHFLDKCPKSHININRVIYFDPNYVKKYKNFIR